MAVFAAFPDIGMEEIFQSADFQCLSSLCIFELNALQMAHVQGRGCSDVFFLDVSESARATSLREGTPPSIKGKFLALLELIM